MLAFIYENSMMAKRSIAAYVFVHLCKLQSFIFHARMTGYNII